MNELQELRKEILDYIKELRKQRFEPEQVQLLHEMILAYEIFIK